MSAVVISHDSSSSQRGEAGATQPDTGPEATGSAVALSGKEVMGGGGERSGVSATVLLRSGSNIITPVYDAAAAGAAGASGGGGPAAAGDAPAPDPPSLAAAAANATAGMAHPSPAPTTSPAAPPTSQPPLSLPPAAALVAVRGGGRLSLFNTTIACACSAQGSDKAALLVLQYCSATALGCSFTARHSRGVVVAGRGAYFGARACVLAGSRGANLLVKIQGQARLEGCEVACSREGPGVMARGWLDATPAPNKKARAASKLKTSAPVIGGSAGRRVSASGGGAAAKRSSFGKPSLTAPGGLETAPGIDGGQGRRRSSTSGAAGKKKQAAADKTSGRPFLVMDACVVRDNAGPGVVVCDASQFHAELLQCAILGNGAGARAVNGSGTIAGPAAGSARAGPAPAPIVSSGAADSVSAAAAASAGSGGGAGGAGVVLDAGFGKAQLLMRDGVVLENAGPGLHMLVSN